MLLIRHLNFRGRVARGMPCTSFKKSSGYLKDFLFLAFSDGEFLKDFPFKGRIITVGISLPLHSENKFGRILGNAPSRDF